MESCPLNARWVLLKAKRLCLCAVTPTPKTHKQTTISNSRMSAKIDARKSDNAQKNVPHDNLSLVFWNRSCKTNLQCLQGVVVLDSLLHIDLNLVPNVAAGQVQPGNKLIHCTGSSLTKKRSRSRKRRWGGEECQTGTRVCMCVSNPLPPPLSLPLCSPSFAPSNRHNLHAGKQNKRHHQKPTKVACLASNTNDVVVSNFLGMNHHNIVVEFRNCNTCDVGQSENPV